jgi:hypothetical protein
MAAGRGRSSRGNPGLIGHVLTAKLDSITIAE